MGFIDKALEKAKSAPLKTEPETTTPEPEVAPEELMPLTGTITAGYPISLPQEEINYSVTRTIAVDLDLWRRNRIITGKENDPVAEEYKVLRTQILQRTRAANHNTIMFTGPRPNEGKTLTAINLAISLAQEVDQTVLLVDVDLRNPSVHRYLGLPPSPGLVDFFTGGAMIPDLLVHPEGPAKLVVMPGGGYVPEAAEIIGSNMMAELVKELKHFYPNRYVLFDLPPLLSFADAMAFAPYVDGIVLVVESAKTTREDIQLSLDLLKDLPLLGSVLNKLCIDEHPAYYYDYAYESGGSPQKRTFLSRWVR